MASLKIAALAMWACTLGCPSAHSDFTISKKATHDVSCVSGVCTPTAKGANLNVGDLTQMLGAGDTKVKTGGGAVTIQVQDGFSWSTASRLTLGAKHSIGIHKPVSVAGSGSLSLTPNTDGQGGDLLFFDKARIDFADLGSDLVINGSKYLKTQADGYRPDNLLALPECP